MNKSLNIIVIGLLLAIILIQFVCKEKIIIPKPPDYTEQFKRIDQRLDSTDKYIKEKAFKNEYYRNYYVTQFLADTSTNRDTIYTRYKALLDSLGYPRFDSSRQAGLETYKWVLSGTALQTDSNGKSIRYIRRIPVREEGLSGETGIERQRD